MSQLPPGEDEVTFKEFLEYAKFKLATEKRVLMKDPIWDQYTDEGILVEYYALIFEKSKEERSKFLGKVKLSAETIDSFDVWATRMIEKNQKELAEKAEKMEDSVRFNPETIGE